MSTTHSVHPAAQGSVDKGRSGKREVGRGCKQASKSTQGRLPSGSRAAAGFHDRSAMAGTRPDSAQRVSFASVDQTAILTPMIEERCAVGIFHHDTCPGNSPAQPPAQCGHILYIIYACTHGLHSRKEPHPGAMGSSCRSVLAIAPSRRQCTAASTRRSGCGSHLRPGRGQHNQRKIRAVLTMNQRTDGQK